MNSVFAVLLPALALAVGMASTQDVRHSSSAQRQDVLAANTDPTVSPRDDFFAFANGGWFTRHPIPAGQGIWGVRDVVGDEIRARQRRVIEDAAVRKAPHGSLEQLLGDFWFTGMDSVSRNKRGLAPLQADFARIDRIRTTSDVMDLVAMLHTRGATNLLFLAYFEQDYSNSNRMILGLWQGGISMNSAAYYVANDSLTVKVRTAFREYLVNTLGRLDRDRMRAIARAGAVYALEARMGAAWYQGDREQKMGIAELHQLAPTIDWSRYFRRVGLLQTDSVSLGRPRYFVALDSLLKNQPLETWKDYLRFWVINSVSPFLDDRSSADRIAYTSTYFGLSPTLLARSTYVQGAVSGLLREPLAQLLSREYLPAQTKARYEALAESLRVAFRARLGLLEWMSDSTRQRAARKLARVKVTIGYSGTWRDYGTLDVRRDSYVRNLIRINAWSHEGQVKSLRSPVDRTLNQPSPTMTDAGYSDNDNAVNVEPGSLLVPGVRDQELDDAFVYGHSFLGHEISHAFDSEGRHYDADGNRTDWWTARDSAAFEQRASVLVDQYSEVMPVPGIHVDGRRTLRENIADLVGVRVALDAFKKTEQFKRNEPLGGFTPLQRFFLAYAYRQASQATPAQLVTRLRGDSHAPDRERVNVVLMNIPEFYEAFGVRPGDRMYRPESDRASIW